MKRFEPVMEFDGTGMAEDDDGNCVEYDEALEAIANARSELQAVIDEMRNNAKKINEGISSIHHAIYYHLVHE
jgi:division protein CdvB (Snf7/Vps24/ESCRT-III family)